MTNLDAPRGKSDIRQRAKHWLGLSQEARSSVVRGLRGLELAGVPSIPSSCQTSQDSLFVFVPFLCSVIVEHGDETYAYYCQIDKQESQGYPANDRANTGRSLH
jgi:hypothetical protein